MNILTPFEASLLLFGFGVTMFSIVLVVNLRSARRANSDEFLVANRAVSIWRGALSIAVSWVWAPAIFVCSMQSYERGIAGIFWFTVPNVICFFVFVPLAIRLRSLLPQGYTLPQFMLYRFPDSAGVHAVYLIIFFGYQLGAVIINTLAGGLLLHAISGVNVSLTIVAISVIALSYTIASGLKASILTDVIQMLMVLGIALILVPWSVIEAGGLGVVARGLGGVSGDYRDVFNSEVAFSMGIPMTLALLSGPIADQMFFQRAFAVPREKIAKTFVAGGLLFGLVPISLSLLGFLAAGMVMAGSISVGDSQTVGATVVAGLLPRAALYCFCLMAFAGLCSTLDSSLCAISSLVSVDIYKRYINPNATDTQTIGAARIGMLAVATIGTAIALSQPKLLWPFLIYGALASAGFFPTIFALFSRAISARAIMLGVGSSLAFGLPLSFVGNITENTPLIVAGALVSVLFGLIVCASSLLFRERALWKTTSCSWLPE